MTASGKPVHRAGQVHRRRQAGAPVPALATNAQATRGEMGRLLAPALRKAGDIAPADRTYAAKVVSAHTGLTVGLAHPAGTDGARDCVHDATAQLARAGIVGEVIATEELTCVVRRSRSSSRFDMKKSLSLPLKILGIEIGPPRVKPYWLRRNGFLDPCDCSHWLYAYAQ